MADKMTQKDFFKAIIVKLGGTVDGEVKDISNEDIVEFAEGRIAQLAKKSSSRKNSAKNEENENLKAVIADVLADGGRKTVTEIMKANATLSELSNQKVSALLRQMKEDGVVDKVKDKKATLFFAV